ncbi:MAG: SCP2 sterol-binding domain-containing protein [Pseudomonadota bacterium]
MSETPALLKPLESLLERQLKDNSDARRALRQLHGETLALKLEGISVDIYFHATDDGLKLGSDYTDEPAAIISGTPLALASLAGQGGDAASVRRTGVTIHGDTAVAQRFQRLFELLKPDWEEELSRLVGDTVAHRVGEATRQLFGWGRDVGNRMTEDFAEFFTEESRDLPAKAETEAFYDDVDTLRDDVARAEARLKQIERKRTPAD